jgi:ceramide glucosyltransferase
MEGGEPRSNRIAAVRIDGLRFCMIHNIARIVQIVALVGCVSSSIYYLLCLWSVRTFLAARKVDKSACSSSVLPAVSILKPLKGTDPDIYESFRSHCLQDYPEYEIIFGVSDAADPVVGSVEQLQREFPDRAIRLVVSPVKLGANVKVSNLEQMMRTTSHEYLIVNDSDIRVESDYLRRVAAPLMDDQIGMVTCLYRGVAAPTLGSRLESLGISTDFCAGVLVARQIESGVSFGLGSTLAFRRRDLDRIGGFGSIVDYLADDYELGRRIAGLGLKVLLSDVVVETYLPAYDLSGFLAHQMRWARGVRDSRLGGYIGLISTFGFMWALANLIAAHAAPCSWAVLGGIFLLRVAMALAVGKAVLNDRHVLSQLWLLPVRDLIAVAVWLVSFAGHTVTWRGDRFELKDGRLTRIPS